MLRIRQITLRPMANTTLYLFRNDLRLRDNPAWAAATNTTGSVLPLYVLDEDNTHSRPGGATRWWLHHSLSALASEISAAGGKLYLRQGDCVDVLESILQDTRVDRIVLSRGYEPRQRQVEQAIHDNWHEQYEIKRYGSYLLFEPEQIQNGQGLPYKVFTPFWKACLSMPEPAPGKSSAAKDIDFYKPRIASDKLEDWDLLPTRPDWAGGLKGHWQPGEAGAHEQLQRFLKDGLHSYDSDRDLPAINGTSCLSPHLHHGEISPLRIWFEVKKFAANDAALQKQAMSYLRELGWREFSNHLLFHWPELPEQPFRPEFTDFPWQEDEQSLRAWQQGRTGYPIVDAGMRQLWHTGWMHNRVRMIVGSLLVKHLLIHWHHGERWFWDTLVDADQANNSAGWQWVAGSGADAAPYFRVFNPILQGKKFDPDGEYVRRWVPELQQLGKTHIHTPWEADATTLAAAGITLGKDYPRPIVDHAAGRKRALAAFETFNSKRKAG